MNLLTPVLLLLLLALSGCSSEVVPDFTLTCRAFFANPGGTVSPPTVFTGNNYKQICQIREKMFEYATLYDTANRIPVYSAYRFEGIMSCKRLTPWYIEPQLEDQRYGAKMACEGSVTLINNQSVNADYTGTSTHHFVKGHLAPVFHATSQSCANATFTLTNAAPQNDKFNNGEWKITENAVAKTLVQNCLPNFAYIVTGVVPGNNTIKNRVRIPSHFWTTYCCLDNNLKVIDSSGFIGRSMNYPVQQMSVKDLEGNLTILYGQGTFRVFNGNCY